MHVPGRPVMRPEDFRLIKEFVADVFGLVLEEGKEGYLALKLLPRLEELRIGTFADYYAYLKFAPRAAAEHEKFISIITNNETYFFREEAQLRVFSEEILPALKDRKLKEGSRSIRIISAGCSSGEEVYTLAMLLMESGYFIWDWDVRICGIDIDPQVLAKAESGVYNSRSFQTTAPHLIERYFKKCDEGTMVKEILRKNTDFIHGNLLQFDKVVGEYDADIIFCRNVLIYFSDDTIKRIVAGFSRALGKEGMLFLGHSESLSRITNAFLPLRFPGAIVYKKRD